MGTHQQKHKSEPMPAVRVRLGSFDLKNKNQNRMQNQESELDSIKKNSFCNNFNCVNRTGFEQFLISLDFDCITLLDVMLDISRVHGIVLS